jgi:calnexin
VIEKGEKQPNITIGVLVSVVVVFVTVLFRILFGGKKPVVRSSQPLFYSPSHPGLEENA